MCHANESKNTYFYNQSRRDIMPPGWSLISPAACFSVITSGRVHLDVCWVHQSTQWTVASVACLHSHL
jgi:hypothetical protein